MTDLNQEERILKAKILLQKEKPFWAWLISYLKIREGLPEEMPMPTMGVSQDGTLLYAKEFIDKQSDEQLKGCLAHETAHLIFDHLLRRGHRSPIGWNIAADIVVNAVLKNDGFELPTGILTPKQDGSDWVFEHGSLKIDNLLKRTSEEVYELLPKTGGKIGKGKGGCGGVKGQWDNHKEGDQKPGEDGLEGTGVSGKEWKKRAIEAATFARMQGHLPAEIERLVGELVNNKVSWKHLLRRYITNTVPNDWTYARPNKRSQAVGVYMPRLKKENTKIVVAIDTSGSIQQEELAQFTAEMVSMAKTLPHVEMTVLQCDAKVHELLKIENGNIAKIKNMKVKGGGGCYDDKTELLTKEGWKLFKDVKANEIVATLNPKTNQLEYQKITGIINREYKGKMVRILSEGRGQPSVDLLVTPEHNMFIEKYRRHHDKWERVAAKDLPLIFKLKKTGMWKGKEKRRFVLPSFTRVWKREIDRNARSRTHPKQTVDMDAWLKFFGLYVAEGSILNGKTVEIPQVRKIASVRKILDAIPFKHTFAPRGRHSVFRIYSTKLAMYLAQFGKADQKFVPDFIKELSSRQIKLFLDGYTVGDGHITPSGLREWSTISKRLADDILELLLKADSSGNIHFLDRGGNRRKIYRIGEHKKKCFRMRTDKYVTQVKYHGRIHCVEVPNHILYVRRNGNPVWCGNTDFVPVFEKLKELQEQTQVLVYFTDGYGNFPKKKYPWHTIWAVVKEGEKDDKFPFGKVVRLE